MDLRIALFNILITGISGGLFACSSVDFSGSSQRVFRSDDSVSTNQDDTTQDHSISKSSAVPSEGEMAQAFDVDQTPFYPVELSLDIAVNAAPAVQLTSVDQFNQALYASLTCQADDAASGDCQDPGDLTRHYALTDLAVFLAAIDVDALTTSPTIRDELLQLAETKRSTPHALESNRLEFGPLPLPDLGKDQALAVVVAYTPPDKGKESTSFKLFIADQRTTTP